MSKKINKNNKDLHFLKEINNFLTKEECQKYMDIINNDPKKQYIKKGNCTQYQRVLLYNEKLADEIFERIKHFLPKDNKNYIGCNPMFRIAKYKEGGQFEIHRDGVNKTKTGKTYLTLNIFLNNDFKGGETDFYLDNKITLRKSVKPEIGKATLFYHKQYHCGNLVINGEKYLFRTDILV